MYPFIEPGNSQRCTCTCFYACTFFFSSQVSLQETKSIPEGAKERGVGLSGSLDCVANVEKLIFEKLNARRVTSLAPSPAEVRFGCTTCVYSYVYNSIDGAHRLSNKKTSSVEVVRVYVADELSTIDCLMLWSSSVVPTHVPCGT